jgi:DNA-binding IclR family transcriptional regulator
MGTMSTVTRVARPRRLPPAPAEAKPGPEGAQSIRRAVAVLRQIATYDRGGIQLVELIRHLGLKRSTTHRILQCLVAENVVMQREPGRRYFLGPVAFELGLTAARRFPLAALCRPALARLVAATGDVAFLSVRSGLEMACIDRMEGDYPVKAYTLDVGARRPLGFGAVGGAILSLFPEREIRDVLRRNARALNAYSKLTVEAALQDVLLAKQRGYALNARPTMQLKAVAVPFRDGAGEPLGALSLCAISSRMRDKRVQELVGLLRAEVKGIEARLRADVAASLSSEAGAA